MKNGFVIFFTILFLFSTTFASDKVNIKEFTSEVTKYSNEILPEFSNENWLEELIKRRYEIRWTRCLRKNSKNIFE